jgi:hypothetical protein
VEPVEPPEAILKKCPLCGVMTRAEFGYCRACNYRLPGGESIKAVGASGTQGDGQAAGVKARKNGYAIAGLCLGIAAVFLYQIGLIPILAVVFSSIGLYKGGAHEGIEAVEAWIGLALGIIFTLSYLHYYGYI